VILRNEHLTGNPLLGAGAVHHITNCREQPQQNALSEWVQHHFAQQQRALNGY
jgi:hypothetical protein